MKSKRLFQGILAGALLFSPCAASAQPDSAMIKERMGKIAADLTLTPDQKTRLLALRKQHGGEMKPLFDKLKGLREKTKEELLKTQPSGQALDGFATAAGEIHKQMAAKRHQHLLQLKAILTPDQFSKLVNREGMDREKQKHRRHGRRHEDCPHHEDETPGGM